MNTPMLIDYLKKCLLPSPAGYRMIHLLKIHQESVTAVLEALAAAQIQVHPMNQKNYSQRFFADSLSKSVDKGETVALIPDPENLTEFYREISIWKDKLKNPQNATGQYQDFRCLIIADEATHSAGTWELTQLADSIFDIAA